MEPVSRIAKRLFGVLLFPGILFMGMGCAGDRSDSAADAAKTVMTYYAMPG